MKSTLKTIRFSPEEWSGIQSYLRDNPSFESISSLGRVAIMDFIKGRSFLLLSPLPDAQKESRPSFLWDYDLTEAQVRELLRHAPFEQRKWLMARILERGSLEEVLRYLTVEEIQKALPSLRINPKVKRHWQEAVKLWTEPRSLKRS